MTPDSALTIKAAFDFISAAFLLAGLFFMFVGATGVVRLPDTYHRIHAASICVTLGLTAMLVASVFHLQAAPILMKSVITIVFIFVATPMGSHMLAKAAHDTGLSQWPHTLSDELAEDKQQLQWPEGVDSPRIDDAGNDGVGELHTA